MLPNDAESLPKDTTIIDTAAAYLQSKSISRLLRNAPVSHDVPIFRLCINGVVQHSFACVSTALYSMLHTTIRAEATPLLVLRIPRLHVLAQYPATIDNIPPLGRRRKCLYMRIRREGWCCPNDAETLTESIRYRYNNNPWDYTCNNLMDLGTI